MEDELIKIWQSSPKTEQIKVREISRLMIELWKTSSKSYFKEDG